MAVRCAALAAFSRDYFGDYRVRSALWMEYNIGGGVAMVLARQPATPVPVHISNAIAWANYYWPFFLAKHGRENLRSHGIFFDARAAHVGMMPPGSLVLCRVIDEGPLLAAGLARVAHVPESGGQPWFTVLQK